MREAIVREWAERNWALGEGVCRDGYTVRERRLNEGRAPEEWRRVKKRGELGTPRRASERSLGRGRGDNGRSRFESNFRAASSSWVDPGPTISKTSSDDEHARINAVVGSFSNNQGLEGIYVESS